MQSELNEAKLLVNLGKRFTGNIERLLCAVLHDRFKIRLVRHQTVELIVNRL